jgi:tetratricopeptide (TPR) repeat protein
MTAQQILASGAALSGLAVVGVLLTFLAWRRGRPLGDSRNIFAVLLLVALAPVTLVVGFGYPLLREAEMRADRFQTELEQKGLVAEKELGYKTAELDLHRQLVEQKRKENEGIILTEGDWPYWSRQAEVEWSQGKNAEALGSLTKAIDLMHKEVNLHGQHRGPRRVSLNDISGLYMIRGQRYLQNKQADKAIEDFSAAIRLDESRMQDSLSFSGSKGYQARGQAYEAAKQWDKALPDYVKAVTEHHAHSDDALRRIESLAQTCPDQKIRQEAARFLETRR